MPKPGTHNILHVLVNGGPDEWALSRDVPAGQDSEVMLVRFDDVPDHLADEILNGGKVSHRWDELCQGPHQTL